ncbi:PilN domain-containing protein [Fictibacillus iocasae]|uniref:PilN domain-containing protein n=1 Tax=Fictibacillus iocasae TaxID=2715437 RepID=A0ABW2NUF4_9BACL
MLVDINLLPQQKQKSLSFVVTVIAAAIIILGSGTYLGLDYYVTQGELAEKKTELQQQSKLIELLQQKQEPDASTSAEPIEEKVAYIRSKDIEAAGLLQHLTSLLPERGYFLNYEYSEGTTITLNVQFDSMAQSAEYLHQLTSSPYLFNVTLEKMETTNLEEVEAGEDMSAFEELLPRYKGQYKMELQRENLKELTVRADGE